MFVDEILRRFSAEDSVIGKVFGRFVVFLLDERDLIIFVVDSNDIYTG